MIILSDSQVRRYKIATLLIGLVVLWHIYDIKDEILILKRTNADLRTEISGMIKPMLHPVGSPWVCEKGEYVTP